MTTRSTIRSAPLIGGARHGRGSERGRCLSQVANRAFHVELQIGVLPVRRNMPVPQQAQVAIRSHEQFAQCIISHRIPVAPSAARFTHGTPVPEQTSPDHPYPASLTAHADICVRSHHRDSLSHRGGPSRAGRGASPPDPRIAGHQPPSVTAQTPTTRTPPVINPAVRASALESRTSKRGGAAGATRARSSMSQVA